MDAFVASLLQYWTVAWLKRIIRLSLKSWFGGQMLVQKMLRGKQCMILDKSMRIFYLEDNSSLRGMK